MFNRNSQLRFRGPDLLCRAVKFGQVFPLYLSSFLLTLMAVDRAGVTRLSNNVQTVNSSTGPKALRPLIRLAWAAAVAFSLPQLAIFSMTDVDGGERDCWAHFGGKAVEKVERVNLI